MSVQAETRRCRQKAHSDETDNPAEKTADEAGLTLVEVLFTLAIVSVGLLSMAFLQVRSIRDNRTARMKTEATLLAAGTLERLRLLPFDHPDLAEDGSPHRLEANSGAAFWVQWTVWDHQPVAGTKTVRIRVGWTGDRYGHMVRLTGIIGDRSMQ